MGDFWLWKNFVDGKPEYWAFDNPYPCLSEGGDPLTLGEPCGYAIFKDSVNGRPTFLKHNVLRDIKRSQDGLVYELLRIAMYGDRGNSRGMEERIRKVLGYGVEYESK